MRKVFYILTIISLVGVVTFTTVNRTNIQADSKKAVAVVEKDPIRIGEGQLRSQAINKSVPSYPKQAKDEKIEGDVVIAVTIDEQGKVISAKASSGPEIFVAGCEEAAKQWTFNPFIDNDKPVKVSGELSFRFTLKRDF